MTPEGKIKAKITSYLRELEGCYTFTPVGSMYGRAGVPDIIVCFQGRFIGIEVKAPGKLGNQSALQKHAQRRIERAGGVYLLVDSAWPVEQLMESIR